MAKTAQRGGRLIVVYVDDGQGRRLVMGEPASRWSNVIHQPIIAAMNKSELRDLVKALRELGEELPEG